MTDDIQKLIASLRLGEYEDPAEKIGLLSAALVEQQADVALLLNLLRAPQIPLRLAAIDASRGRPEPEILTELFSLLDHPDARVRLKLAEVLATRTDPASTGVVLKLADDSDPDVRVAVLKNTAARPEFRQTQENCLVNNTEWRVRFAAVEALANQQDPLAVKALAAALQRDQDSDVTRRCAEAIERRLRESPLEIEPHLPSDITELSRIEAQLKNVGPLPFPKLAAWVRNQTSSKVDSVALANFGTDLTLLALSGTLPRAHDIENQCETVIKLLHQVPCRSIALIGPAGVGKSALVNELVYRLAVPENGAWHVLRVSPTDFMSGTRYLGEWETKVRDLVQLIRKPRNVLLYVPNLSELSAAGVWSKSDSSVASALAPYLEDGSIVILGESAAEEYERGLGKIPSLRRLFDRVLLVEPSLEATRSVLAAIRDEQHSRISSELLDQLLEVGSQFLGHISRPGNAAELLRAVIRIEKESGRLLTARDILDSLSRSTGIPSDFLDDSIPLKQSEVKEFFERRIMGQPKAVEAVVDLVTLIKAGVTDSNRPFGVLMFIGPTGVGKTELARALAEFIFGDAGRLKRFDMSEFANPEGFTRLIGSQHENGLLTDAVRQHPFSVVLLDEIEKSHVNVFDLCLQIFDAGRLTDGRGRTVDFRRTIIVLTSNVGATSGLMGFNSETDRVPKSTRERVPRELSRSFRPEFLNRIDRIIQFQPLSLEVAEQIARREIQSVLERSGIRRRQIAVDVDPGVVSLIVREGYSPRFGARPLKRTVERLLLLPLAKVIAGGTLQPRTVVRLTQHGARIQATITAPPALRPSGIRKPSGAELQDAARIAALQKQYGALACAVQALTLRKSELIVQTRSPEFSKDAALRASVLNDIHNLEQFLTLHEESGNMLRSIAEHAGRDTSKSVVSLQLERIERLENDMEHLAFVAKCQDAKDLGDALLSISLVNRSGKPQEAVSRIAGMYQALAGRRRMTAEVWGESYSGAEDCAYLLIAGLGAYGLLKLEEGLHQVDHRYKQRAARSGREVLRDDRELVRVGVIPSSPEPAPRFQQQVKTRISPLKPAKERLLKAELEVKVFHEPSLRSISFWTSGPKETAVSRALFILHASVVHASEAQPDRGMVRQYDLGIGPRIKDLRTGRSTTRVNQVFKGGLETLMEAEPRKAP